MRVASLPGLENSKPSHPALKRWTKLSRPAGGTGSLMTRPIDAQPAHWARVAKTRSTRVALHKLQYRHVAAVLLRPIDLRPLQLVGIVHVHRLPLGVEIDGADSAFAVTVACGLHAAEGQVHLGANRRGVDIGDARIRSEEP